MKIFILVFILNKKKIPLLVRLMLSTLYAIVIGIFSPVVIINHFHYVPHSIEYNKSNIYIHQHGDTLCDIPEKKNKKRKKNRQRYILCDQE